MQHIHFFEPRRSTKSPPLVFFLHSALGYARMFYADMNALAEKGFACASLEAPYSRSRNVISPRGMLSPVNERCLWDRTVEELYLGLEEAIAHWGCDRSRVGLLGLNLGGTIGAYWLAKGAPVAAAVISGAIPDLTDFWLHSSHPAALAARAEAGADPDSYEARMRETDLLETVPRIGVVPLLLQFGLADPWIGRESMAVAEDKFTPLGNVKISLLQDDHEMKSPASVLERVNFLSEALR